MCAPHSSRQIWTGPQKLNATNFRRPSDGLRPPRTNVSGATQAVVEPDRGSVGVPYNQALGFL